MQHVIIASHALAWSITDDITFTSDPLLQVQSWSLSSSLETFQIVFWQPYNSFHGEWSLPHSYMTADTFKGHCSSRGVQRGTRSQILEGIVYCIRVVITSSCNRVVLPYNYGEEDNNGRWMWGDCSYAPLLCMVTISTIWCNWLHLLQVFPDVWNSKSLLKNKRFDHSFKGLAGWQPMTSQLQEAPLGSSNQNSWIWPQICIFWGVKTYFLIQKVM